MIDASPTATPTAQPWVALRAFWRAGAVVAVGEVVMLTLSEAGELLAANKIGPAAADPAAEAPAAAARKRAARAAAPAAPARKRAACAKD